MPLVPLYPVSNAADYQILRLARRAVVTLPDDLPDDPASPLLQVRLRWPHLARTLRLLQNYFHSVSPRSGDPRQRSSRWFSWRTKLSIGHLRTDILPRARGRAFPFQTAAQVQKANFARTGHDDFASLNGRHVWSGVHTRTVAALVNFVCDCRDHESMVHTGPPTMREGADTLRDVRRMRKNAASTQHIAYRSPPAIMSSPAESTTRRGR